MFLVIAIALWQEQVDALCDQVHADVDDDVVKAQSKEGSLFVLDVFICIFGK